MTAPRLTLADAEHVLDAALRQADRTGKPMNVAVVDAAGYLVAFARQDGAILASVDIAIGKARTAALLKMTTAELAESAQPGAPLYGIQGTNGGLVVFGGGIPLVEAGEVVGAVGASAGTIDEDIAVARAGVEALGAGDHYRVPQHRIPTGRTT